MAHQPLRKPVEASDEVHLLSGYSPESSNATPWTTKARKSIVIVPTAFLIILLLGLNIVTLLRLRACKQDKTAGSYSDFRDSDLPFKWFTNAARSWYQVLTTNMADHPYLYGLQLRRISRRPARMGYLHSQRLRSSLPQLGRRARPSPI